MSTYDSKQMAAVLTRCTVCGCAFYMTRPRSVCILCRRKENKS